MEIKEPKFREGQKVRYVKDRNIYTIERINSYSFIQNEYDYNLLEKLCTLPESALELYIEKPKTVWELQKGDKCFFINAIGSMIPVKWDGTYCAIRNLEIGNVFLTKEKAEYELERRKVETEMLRLGGRREFKNGENNYYIVCDFDTHYSIVVFNNKTDGFAPMTIYFDSAIDAIDAVQEIGEDRIKKYIFGVE